MAFFPAAFGSERMHCVFARLPGRDLLPRPLWFVLQVVQDFKYFQRVKWQYMILDEAQAIKSSSR